MDDMNENIKLKNVYPDHKYCSVAEIFWAERYATKRNKTLLPSVTFINNVLMIFINDLKIDTFISSIII